MPPKWVAPKVLSWASDIDPAAIQQAARASRLAIVKGHIALQADAHVGIGATVGSVIPTKNAVIPSAVGVDIGCGMIAVETNLTANDLPDSLESYLRRVETTIPAGVGAGHDRISKRVDAWLSANQNPRLTDKQRSKTLSQFGSLGSGNHFFEVCLDERDLVWVVIHSGSRGIGNELANGHIKRAKSLARENHIALEDPDLAYFEQGQPEFAVYIQDMLWSQRYAMANRSAMMDAALEQFFLVVGQGEEKRRINCHHNFTQQEVHGGVELWITRKGAIKASVGDLGVIPGSMGTQSYIVSGRGSALSWESCSHGAGRRYSRSAAKQLFTVDDLTQAMEGKTWLHDKAEALLDEIPAAYKDIDQVMKDQQDLVKVEHKLRQILNYKGAK